MSVNMQLVYWIDIGCASYNFVERRAYEDILLAIDALTMPVDRLQPVCILRLNIRRLRPGQEMPVARRFSSNENILPFFSGYR